MFHFINHFLKLIMTEDKTPTIYCKCYPECTKSVWIGKKADGSLDVTDSCSNACLFGTCEHTKKIVLCKHSNSKTNRCERVAAKGSLYCSITCSYHHCSHD